MMKGYGSGRLGFGQTQAVQMVLAARATIIPAADTAFQLQAETSR